jgi:outer membrane lipoprotein-sorting protein/membrane-associated protease RseP (regulator of RpoE activity)
MIFQYSILMSVLIMLCLIVPIKAKENITDPYDILEKHFEAIGGLDKVKAQIKIYKEGTISIEGTGLKGTFKQWTEKPLRMRQEVDLTVVKDIVGDNGKFRWRIDPNGKVQIQKDDETSKEREVKKLMELYKHLDRNSPHFTLTYEGIEKVNNEDCYVVKITNKINTTVQLDYYNTSSFYLVKTVMVKPDIKHHVFYSDFRKVDGVIQPFREVVEILPIGQKQVIEYAKYEFNSEISASLFEPPHEDVEDFQFVNGENSLDVHIDFIENHLYLPVNINGREELWILDCGASVSVIDSSYAVELGLEFEGPIKGRGATGIVNFYYVTLPSFNLRGIKFREQKVVAMPMRNLFQKAVGLNVVGILGYDFLSRFITKIDYANEKISFYHPDKFKYHGNGKVFDSPLDEGGMFSLPIKVDNIYSGKWRLDIGANSLDFHYPYAKDHNLLGLEGIDGIGAGAAGEFKVRFSQFKTIELDGFKIKNPLIGVPYQEGTGSFSQKSLVGNAGNSFLRHFVLYLDYKNQRVILEKGDNYDYEFPRYKSGLALMYTEDYDIEVHFVAPKTPADEVGFKKGDIIKDINGIDVDYFDGIISIRKLFMEKAGTTFTFSVLRNDEFIGKQLTLRELF